MELKDIQFVDTFMQMEIAERRFTVDVGEASKIDACNELFRLCTDFESLKQAADFCPAVREKLDDLLEPGAFDHIFGERKSNDLAVRQICSRIVMAFNVRRGEIIAEVFGGFRRDIEAETESIAARAAGEAPPSVQ